MPEEKTESRRIFVEAPSGGRFEADVPCGTPLGHVAADFFESQRWPTQGQDGFRQRAVVELVNPKNPDDTKRLNSELDICEADVRDGDTLRIFPESIAGAVDHRARLNALIADHHELQNLAESNPEITFEANRTLGPDRYEVTLNFPSFIELVPGESVPRKGDSHRVEITLGNGYPRKAPLVRWLTPIFHPNISAVNNTVCLGVLGERYLPGLGLARLVRLLAEMVQWRNFDASNGLNFAAAEWAGNPEHWPQIQAIGGHLFQGPVAEFLEELKRKNRPKITFRPLGKSA